MLLLVSVVTLPFVSASGRSPALRASRRAVVAALLCLILLLLLLLQFR